MQIEIPASITEAKRKLAGLDALLTATEWERAAVVAAFVTLGQKPGPKDRAESHDLTPREFAALGIAGLKSNKTVVHYVKAWEDTGIGRPTPGEVFTVPDRDLGAFPANPSVGQNVDEDRKEAIRAQAQADGTGASKAIDIASNPRAMAAAIKADPKVAKAAAQALVESDTIEAVLDSAPLRNKLISKIDQYEEIGAAIGNERKKNTQAPAIKDAIGDPDLATAITALYRVHSKIERGDFRPTKAIKGQMDELAESVAFITTEIAFAGSKR